MVRYESQAARRRRRRQRRAEREQEAAHAVPPPTEYVSRPVNEWPWRTRTRPMALTERCNCSIHNCYYQQIVARFGAVAHIDLEFGEPIPPRPPVIPVARVLPQLRQGAVRPSATGRLPMAATTTATAAAAAATAASLYPQTATAHNAWDLLSQEVPTFQLPPMNQPDATRRQTCLNQLRILVPHGNHGGWANQSLAYIEHLLAAAGHWWAINGCPPTEDQVLFTMYGDELWD